MMTSETRGEAPKEGSAMTFQENDQPRAGDGKWGPKQQHEAVNVVLAAPGGSVRPRPIMATATLQEWNENDETEEVGTIEFDAAPIIAGMAPNLSPEDLADLDHSTRDDIFNEAMARGFIPMHDGPFEVDVQESLDEVLAENPNYFDTPYPHNMTVRHPEVAIESPLSPYELGARMDEDGYVKALAVLDLDDMVDHDVEEHNDAVSKTLVGNRLLMDINTSPERISVDKASGSSTVVFSIAGDVSAVVECLDDDELDLFEAGLADAEAARNA